MNSSTTSIDPFHILCIEPGASEADVKSAYRRMAKRFHPDINKDEDAPRKFRLVQEAFQKIKDGYKPTRPSPRDIRAGTAAYKIYEIVPEHSSTTTIIRSETVLPAGTQIHIMKGSRMFRVQLDERKRLPFDMTAGGTVFKFRNAPEGFR